MKIRNNLLILIVIITPAAHSWASPENPNVGNPLTPRNTVPSANQPRRMITQPNTNYSNNFRGIAPYGVRRYDTFGSPSIPSLERRTGSVFVDRSPEAFRSDYTVRQSISPYPSRLQPSPSRTQSNLSAPGVNSPYVIPNLPQLNNTQFNRRPLTANTQALDALLSKQIKLDNEKISNRTNNKNAEPINLNLYDTLTPEQIKELIDKQSKQEDIELSDELQPEEQIFADFMKEQQGALNNPNNDTPENNESSSGTGDSELVKPLDQGAVDAALIAEGRKILGEHKTFASLAESKVAIYLKAGQDFLKQRQYYKAADAYTLGAVWNPNDGRVYFGQSVALFAAGEYMSSAYYLSRAFELDSTLASVKYDIPGIVGDRDTYENRILEISEWQQRSNSGELAFLLAYLFSQDGKPARAAASIKTAVEAMPENAGIQALKNVITPNQQGQ